MKIELIGRKVNAKIQVWEHVREDEYESKTKLIEGTFVGFGSKTRRINSEYVPETAAIVLNEENGSLHLVDFENITFKKEKYDHE